MKKSRFIGALVAILALGTVGVISSFKGNNAVEVKADDVHYYDRVSTQNGYFKKVTDVSSIQNNEKLLLVARENRCIQFHIGASYHYFVTTEFAEIKYYSDEYVYMNDERAELVTFEKVGDSTFRLKLDHYVDYAINRGTEQHGYLVHEAYNNDGVTAYGDLFIRKNADQPNDNQGRWNLSYDGSHMRITSLSGRLLHWKGGTNYLWDALIASTHTEWDSDINLYRYIGNALPDSGDAIVPYRTDYSEEDVLNLHGLGVNMPLVHETTGYKEYIINYDSCPRFFECDTYVDYTSVPVDQRYGIKLRHFTYLPSGKDFEFTITIVENIQRSYTIMNTAIMNDIRGTYIAVAEDAGVAYCPGADVTADSDSGLYQYKNGHAISLQGCGFYPSYHVINNPSYDLYTSGVFTIEKEYHAEVPSGGWYNTKVFAPGGRSMSYSDDDATQHDWNSYIKFSNDEWDAPTIVDAELHFGGRALRYDATAGKFLLSSDTNLKAAKLYRLDINSEIMKEMNNWKKDSFDKEIRSRCNSSGNTGESYLNAIRAAWGDLHHRDFTIETDFYTKQFLSPDAQSYLARLIYTHNAHAYDTLESMIDCYDFMVYKYGLPDFMFRGEAGTLNTFDYGTEPSDHQEEPSSLIRLLGGDKDTLTMTIIISIATITSIAALSGIYIFKKKRM